MKTKFTLSLFVLLSSIGVFAQVSAIITPSSTFIGSGTYVTIIGSGTKFLTGTNNITFVSGTDVSGDIVLSNQKVVDDFTITGTVSVSSNAKSDTYVVRIANDINPVINILPGFTVKSYPDSTSKTFDFSLINQAFPER